MNILGISAFYHDSAACLVRDGEIIAAAQEERFTRRKHDASFPKNAVRYCLEEAAIGVDGLDIVAFYEKPFIKFERILETYVTYAPSGLRSFLKAMPLWVKERMWMKECIKRELGFSGTIVFPEHHESHAASAFFPSPFPEAAFLTVDGVGEWATASYGIGSGNTVKLLAELHFPHSLGLLYSAFTYFTGFKVNSAEYKVMGLAPYGDPVYRDLILREIVDLKEDGSFALNMKYFNYCAGLTMVNKRFWRLFGGPPRKPESRLTRRDMDLARSVQEVTEEVMLRMARHVHRRTGMARLCLAGGVALNCVANGRVLREGPFKEVWVQPASGDAGGAVGAALFSWYQYAGNARRADGSKDSMKGSYLGPQFGRDDIAAFLAREKISSVELGDEALAQTVADLIAGEKVIGWFQGRMEFGPRALGGRSIIGDARSPTMQETMNLKIKFRESFRPFAPSVLKERASDYFEFEGESPYMLIVAPVKSEPGRPPSGEEGHLTGLARLRAVRGSIPAVTHVDRSARLHTVDSATNPLFYQVIRRFDEKYACPVIINTSFNVRGEPIVCTPSDAYRCFMRTNMDYLVMGNFLVEKRGQKPLDKDIDWLKEFELD